jgi:hypothetical protein
MISELILIAERYPIQLSAYPLQSMSATVIDLLLHQAERREALLAGLGSGAAGLSMPLYTAGLSGVRRSTWALIEERGGLKG